MRRSLILLCLLASYTATPGTSPRRAETFGDWSTPFPVASLNTDSNDMYAVLSKDELTVYFTSDRQGTIGMEDLWYATRDSADAAWGPAQNMSGINSVATDSLPMLSYDEHVMFFQSTRAEGCGKGDIWMTRRRDKRSQDWEVPINLGCALSTVNTGANETAPAFFENPETAEVTLYYGSDRTGGLGDYDVYASVVGEDGDFGQGLLVPEFSSLKRDTRIFIRKDGLEAFITSSRDTGQGLIDIWTSTRETLSDPWPPIPTDLPSPINSTCDDGSPSLSRDGTTLYFFSNRTTGLQCGNRDIWYATREKIKEENAIQAMVGRFNRMVAHLIGEPSS
jgi:WD40 repeat protein